GAARRSADPQAVSSRGSRAYVRSLRSGGGGRSAARGGRRREPRPARPDRVRDRGVGGARGVLDRAGGPVRAVVAGAVGRPELSPPGRGGTRRASDGA